MSTPLVAPPESPEFASAISKASKRILPMLVILYIVSFLDRTNVGFAASGLEVDRGISAAAYAFGAGIFFIGYALFEIPSNLLLNKYGAKFWLARIGITWGIVSASFAFVQGENSFIILRFLLGVTEAGLFPGVIMFLAAWFPNNVRVKMLAIFYLGLPISQAIGSPLSGWLISLGDQLGWIAGWQLMFFTEGALAVAAGVAAYFVLVNSPQEAKFLTDEEKAALTAAMDAEEMLKSTQSPKGVFRAMANGRVWYFTAIYFCLQLAVYGVTFYLPQQVADLTGQKVGWKVGLLVAVPWIIGAFSLFFFGRYASTVLRRRRLGVLFYLVTGVCIFGASWAGTIGHPILGLVFITVAISSFLAVSPITWSYPTAFLAAGTTAAAGIGLINSIGNLGGFVAPIMRTRLNELADSEVVGVYALAAFPIIAAALMFGTRYFSTKADDLLAQERAHTTTGK